MNADDRFAPPAEEDLARLVHQAPLAWLLSPDRELPRRMRLKESRKVPMWNGPLECRLFKFDMVKGRLAKGAAAQEPND